MRFFLLLSVAFAFGTASAAVHAQESPSGQPPAPAPPLPAAPTDPSPSGAPVDGAVQPAPLPPATAPMTTSAPPSTGTPYVPPRVEPPPPPLIPAPEAPENAAPATDELRFRSGISSAVGPSTGDFPGWMLAPFQLRLGVQILEELAIVYQNTGYLIFFENPASGSDGNIVDQNAILGLVTIEDIVDLGGGVSLDVFNTSDGVSAGPGLEVRAAVNLGPGSNEESARRVAFNIGVDMHLTFVEDDVLVVFPFGLGAEFY